MREIKFRVWDRIKKEFELIDSLYELQKMNLSDAEFLNKDFLQFTGLEDKNGVEIYEGDVIQYYPEDGIAIAQIVFDENEDEGTFLCGFNCRLLNNIDYPDEEYDARELEVIGNIYENPELLGNKGELK